ncbi:hypothetical protein NDU88_005375 [Pleurodeles waltl]|uniref:Uncharacterized protein n=1 Tax=Pleurodeles waltl TaxID=8319 RepID=A0AAV7LP06_PLEWA|nr:hypothetical protein NDU88_005375 [Pleurodeles waltl]
MLAHRSLYILEISLRPPAMYSSITSALEQCSPNPGPLTGAGPRIKRHRAARGTSNHFTVAGGRGAEHCALPSPPIV